jgi:hypothetical protein
MIKRAGAYLVLTAVAAIAGFFGGRLAESGQSSPSKQSIPLSIRSKRFEVVDDSGQVAVELTGHELNILDGHGKVRVTLRLGQKDNGVLGFSDAKWEGRAIFGFLGTDTPSETDDDWGLVIRRPGGSDVSILSLRTMENSSRGLLYVAGRNGVHNTFAP